MLGLFRKRTRQGLDLRAPIADTLFAVVDTELTGLDEAKDSIISIGAVAMTGGRIELGTSFYRLVSPEAELTPENVIIHEITPSEVAAGPAIEAVLDDFLEFCGNRVLIGHFAAVDMAFLDRDAKRGRGEGIRNSVIDTYSIYGWLQGRYPGHSLLAAPGERHNLYDIAKSMGVPVNGAHNALMDAFTTALLFQRFIPLLLHTGVQELGELLRIGMPFKGGDGFKQTGEISNF